MTCLSDKHFIPRFIKRTKMLSTKFKSLMRKFNRKWRAIVEIRMNLFVCSKKYITVVRFSNKNCCNSIYFLHSVEKRFAKLIRIKFLNFHTVCISSALSMCSFFVWFLLFITFFLHPFLYYFQLQQITWRPVWSTQEHQVLFHSSILLII